MASCFRNIPTENYRKLVIGFQITVENVGDTFFGTQCTLSSCTLHHLLLEMLECALVCLFACSYSVPLWATLTHGKSLLDFY